MILVDSGPLVALLHEDDDKHDICKAEFQAIDETLVTVWPALTEAMHLLRFSAVAQSALCEMIESGAVSILPLDEADVPRIKALMRQYRDLPMDFADAALVRVAEREKLLKVFTLDRRDFQVYRPSRIGRVSIIPGR